MTQLKLNSQVGELFQAILQIPKGCHIFTNGLDPIHEAMMTLNFHGAKISAVASEKLAKHWATQENPEWSVIHYNDISFFKPEDTYHLAFGLPLYDVVEAYPDNEETAGIYITQPHEIADRMMLFECSKGRPGRRVPAHLMTLEAMLSSVIVGGYIAAVMPTKWLGREMKFMTWWQQYAAPVARINLPAGSVLRKVDDVWLNAPGDWTFFIWQRPAGTDSHAEQSRRHVAKTEFAELRWTTFVFTLESLELEEIDRCCGRFRKNDWWLNNVKLWRRLLDTNSQHQWCGTYRRLAHKLADPADIWLFEPTDKNMPKLSVVNNEAGMLKNTQSVRIKPGPPVRIEGNSDSARAIIHDMMVNSGVSFMDEKGYAFNLRDVLSREHYSKLGENLVRELKQRGLRPYMTAADAQKLQKSERWLAVQLTPIERQIPIRGEEHLLLDSDTSGEEHEEDDIPEVNGDEASSVNWEIAYEDIGLRATFPDLVQMWESRAHAMRLHTILYDFQFDDAVTMAIKYGLINGNHMGLGKTRECLATALLLCIKNSLFVVPTKLLGVWQEEIENTIQPFVRRQRRNWQGKIMHADYKIIQWGEDVLDEPLAAINLISYEKLKSIPRDGRFFKCPTCKFVAYSVRQKKMQLCPRCNHRRNVEWRQKCEAKMDDDGRMIRSALRKHKIDISTGKKIHWSNPDKVKCRIVDPRPAKPALVVMEEQEHVYKKMIEKVIRRDHNPLTGITKEVKKVVERPGLHTKWTFANQIRWMFSFICADEALYFKSRDAKRTLAMLHMCARRRIANTGTPVKGFPQNIIAIWNWAIDRVVFPHYQLHDPQGYGRFMRKFETKVKISDEEGNVKWKQVPKINNPELFQAEVAPTLLRHTRNEPQVTKDIPKKNVELRHIKVSMDDEHREYYQKWLDKFSEWWQMMKEEEEGRMAGKGALITKLGYLINASTIPHFMLDRISQSKDADMRAWALMIGRYQANSPKKTPHQKMLKAREIIRKAIAKGDKVIVGSIRRKNLDVGMAWCRNVGINALKIDGTVDAQVRLGKKRSKRHELVDKFRHYDYHVLWAGMGALAEGMNIPEANWGIVMDYDWDPSTWKQFIGRMIRPQQSKTVHARFLMHYGTIDDYIAAWCLLKERAMDEGVDYMEFDDFSVEMIPDIHQYADSIVDGTEESLKANMWLSIEHIKRMAEQGDDE